MSGLGSRWNLSPKTQYRSSSNICTILGLSRAGRQDLAEAAAIARAGEGVVHGATCTEKKSVFQAHVAPAVAVEDVRAVVAALMQNRKVQAATHNIMAYRCPRRPQYHEDCMAGGSSSPGFAESIRRVQLPLHGLT